MNSAAAPPSITTIHPSGARRGTTVEVVPAGTIDAATKVWAGGAGVSVEVEKGKFKVAVAKDAAPGTVWLRAYNADGASGLRPFIVGTLPEVAEKESNDEPKKAQAVKESAVVNGKLEKSGDVDCFAVDLKKGQTLVASLEANRTLRSPVDAILQVTLDGFLVEENNDHRGLDPQAVLTARKDGTYVVRVFAFPATPDSSIRFFGSEASIYRLTLTTGPFADFAVPLAVSGEDSKVEVRGWNVAPKPSSVALGLADDPFALAIAPGAPNPVRVRAEQHPTFGPKLEGAPKPPFSATGAIDKPGAEALLPFAGKKGQALSIQVESRSFGLAVNPVVRVLDSKKEQLARAEPGKLNTDVTVAFTPPADGTYTIAVSDLFAGGGPRHVFLARVLSEPDYELTVAGDRFTAAPGKALSIPVKVNRVRGFNKPVEVTAEGLPEGVKVELTKPAKPDPNTVSLSVTAEKPWSGPFRLVGRVKDDANSTRHARAAVPEFEETTAELWLTVTGPTKK